MRNTIQDETRERLAAFLPGAIAQALESYRKFMEEQGGAVPPRGSDTQKLSNAKHFKDHHDACKVAIAHIELLLKLAETVRGETQDDDSALDAEVAKAQAEIRERKI